VLFCADVFFADAFFAGAFFAGAFFDDVVFAGAFFDDVVFTAVFFVGAFFVGAFFDGAFFVRAFFVGEVSAALSSASPFSRSSITSRRNRIMRLRCVFGVVLHFPLSLRRCAILNLSPASDVV
jgi:uncharacterized protein YjbI with pentapeptide repeats